MHQRLLWGIAGVVGVVFGTWVADSNAPLAQAPQRTHLVIVIDGLRPDYVTADVMPRLTRLRQRGIGFNAHHAVFPTVTRVNASSFVTGAYPETHGLLGNTIFSPKANPARGLDTAQRANLEAVERAEGALLTAPTLGELLTKAGKRLLVVSSGSSGSAFLLNHKVGSGAIVHPEFIRPEALAPRIAPMVGPAPPKLVPNDGQNQYAIDAYLKFGLDNLKPDVTMMWLNDPDATAHENGIGAAVTRKSLALVDAGIGRVEDGLRSKGLLNHTNIIVTSDHGFSTHSGTLRLRQIVGTSGIVIAEGAIYLRQGNDPARVAGIVAALQRRPEVGAIFTRAAGKGSVAGVVPGTLSFEMARWNHARSGEILVSGNWSDDANKAGFRGTTTQGGVAGHGTSSPYDIHNTLIAAGPDFRERTTSEVPTGNVDIAPTLLHLLAMPAPQTMTGRVIREGLRSGPSPASIRVEQVSETVRTPDGRYELTARFSMAAGHRYLDGTTVRRSEGR
jgi:predicted AlkP superfamily pyrophosphatase or phosphodiesterase